MYLTQVFFAINIWPCLVPTIFSTMWDWMVSSLVQTIFLCYVVLDCILFSANCFLCAMQDWIVQKLVQIVFCVVWDWMVSSLVQANFFVLCGIGQYLVWYKLFFFLFFFCVIWDWMVSSLVQAIFLYVNCEGCLVQAGLLVMYVSIIFLPQNYKLRSLKIMPFPNLCVDFPRTVFLYSLDCSNRWQHLRWNSP